MPFDALTLAAVRQELQQKLVGGRIQNVIMPGPLAVSLEVYRPGTGRAHLLLSAHPQHARVHLTQTTPSRDPDQHPPLLLLLRKYVRGGTLLDVVQPRFERVLVLSIAKRLPPDKHQEYHFEGDFRDTDEPQEDDPTLPLTTVELVVEVMGRVSNIILLEEDGSIMDSAKRVPASINRYRTTLPHYAYVAPPPQDKRDPTHTSINAMALELGKALAEDANAAAWKGLVSGYAAISPALAREVMYRALGNAREKAADIETQPALLAKVLEELQAIFRMESEGSWQPTVAWKAGGEDEGRQALDFAPYRPLHLQAQDAQLEEFTSISAAASRYFNAIQTLGGHSALKGIVAAALGDLRSRDERKLYSLREEWQRAQSLETLRRKGELLLSYMHTLQPGQTTLVIPDENLTIELDPGFTPVENSQAIFREYRKARSAVEGLPERIEEMETRIAYLDDLATSLDIATTYDDIKAVQAEVKSASKPPTPPDPAATKQKQQGKGKGRAGQPKLPQPLRLQTHNGVQLLVGRTAGQNDTATFRLASPDDLWFHARGAPGSHVILRAAPNLSPEDIEEAARLAAGYSKRREDAQVDVIYTEKKHVRKIPNSPPGQVTYKNERVIRVGPLRLQAARQGG
ncbi:MAG: NFACT RNA binding domain-containing protein [Chloroflexota bacterium]